MMLQTRSTVVSVLLSALMASAQLTKTVGPTTSSAAKRNTICSVLDYGGSIGSSDIGPAISSAFTNCVLKNSGSTLYVPAGSYSMQTWVTLNAGSHWAFQLDGFITRTATTTGNMIAVTNAVDFEWYSSTSAGGIQGNGYQCRNAGPRLMRITGSTSFSVHDMILVDSPEFHLTVDTGEQGEVYNMAIRGADIGGSDGVDVWGDNVWVHDVEVTNRDECVTVKSPATNILVEQIWCNQSGGSAMGSLGADTAISNIEYNYVYTNGGNQAYMIKSNGGSGTVSNVLLQNFISSDTAYGLYINQYWSSESVQPGDGVQLSNIQFVNWDGNVASGTTRPPIALICADGAPCHGITLTNVNMWSLTGSAIAKCESAYGSGLGCIHSGSSYTSYAVTTSTMTKPSGYSTPTTMPGDLSAGFTSVSPIPTPTMPSSFYPGRAPFSALAKNIKTTSVAASTTTTKATSSTTKASSTTSTVKTTTSTAATSTGTTVPLYGQCGGIGYTGSTTCVAGSTCTYSNDYYSQCLAS